MVSNVKKPCSRTTEPDFFALSPHYTRNLPRNNAAKSKRGYTNQSNVKITPIYFSYCRCSCILMTSSFSNDFYDSYFHAYCRLHSVPSVSVDHNHCLTVLLSLSPTCCEYMISELPLQECSMYPVPLCYQWRETYSLVKYHGCKLGSLSSQLVLKSKSDQVRQTDCRTEI